VLIVGTGPFGSGRRGGRWLRSRLGFRPL